jgi:hypothetical protein
MYGANQDFNSRGKDGDRGIGETAASGHDAFGGAEVGALQHGRTDAENSKYKIKHGFVRYQDTAGCRQCRTFFDVTRLD